MTPLSKTARAETVTLNLFYDGADHLYTAEPVSLNVNGSNITNLIMPPVIMEDYTLVPAREVFEPMNAAVDWNAGTSTVYIYHNDAQIILTIDNKYALVNGQIVVMPVPAKIINEKMMIPLRFVADNLNFLVYWDEKTRTAHIDDLSVIYSDPGYAAASFEFSYQPEPEDYTTSIISNIQTSDADVFIPARDMSTSFIAEEFHSETSIIEIETPYHGNNRFTIRASSAISKVETHLLSDNRMYIDIYNSVMRLTTTSYSMPDNPSVAAVRAAQNQLNPDMITRIVFDLKDGAEYNISISADRREIYVGFVRNVIYGVSLYPEGASDTLIIQGQTTPSVSVYPFYEQNQLIIDVPYASAAQTIEQFNLNGRFVTGFRLEQTDFDTARITVNLTEHVMYDIRTDAETAAIRLSGRTFYNLEYSIGLKLLTIKKHANYPMDIASFRHIDNYSSFKYTILFGGDYSGYLGNGDYTIRDSQLNSINLRTTNGITGLEFNQTVVNAFLVYEDSENIYIQVVHPKEKYPYIVILDPGHGGGDNGTTANGLIEREINLDISNRVLNLFEQDGRIKAYATRTTDIYPTLEERVEFGFNLGDLFLSIHNNFAPIRSGSRTPNPDVSGTETFFYPHETDEMHGILSETVAEIMQKHIVAGFGSNDRGVKQARYLVLDSLRIPAALLEVGFVSSESDARKLATEEYRQRVAESIYRGVSEIFNRYTPLRTFDWPW